PPGPEQRPVAPRMLYAVLGRSDVEVGCLTNSVAGSRIDDLALQGEGAALVPDDLDGREGRGSDLLELLLRKAHLLPLDVVEKVSFRRVPIRRGNPIYACRLLRARLTPLRPELREEEEEEPDGGRDEPNHDARLF